MITCLCRPTLHNTLEFKLLKGSGIRCEVVKSRQFNGSVKILLVRYETVVGQSTSAVITQYVAHNAFQLTQLRQCPRPPPDVVRVSRTQTGPRCVCPLVVGSVKLDVDL